MSLAYYNEFDPYAGQWLENLISAGHIMPGKVDKRSIKDVTGADLDGFTRAHFFAGIAGWDLALRLAGWPPDRPVWTGSCPCQPFSDAGQHRGAMDARHLWPDFYTLVMAQMPPTIFGEQVASADGRKWLGDIRADLEALGYSFGASDLCAASLGAPHIRQRLFWVANLDRQGFADTQGRQGSAGATRRAIPAHAPSFSRVQGWLPKPEDGWTVHGVSAKVGAVRAYGNAIVPALAAEFISAFMEAELEAP